MADKPFVRRYTDGHPLDTVRYREYKILLNPERFFTPDQFEEFWGITVDIAEELGIKSTVNEDPFKRHVRRVLFYDTPNFDLYRNAFILRKRTFYVDGWPQSEHELAAKFRHPDLDETAAVNMRPHMPGDLRIKFKEEILPLKTELGGFRSLYSHNSILITENFVIDNNLKEIEKNLPAMQRIPMVENASISLVNNFSVEEVEVVPGYYHFGHGYKAKASIAVWRNRATEQLLVGEFAFQAKFERMDDVHAKALKLSEEFFVEIQRAAPDWIQMGTTKTAMVYGMQHQDAIGHD